MQRRYTAFLLTAAGGAVELFGALYGQGVMGAGGLFGLLGTSSRSEAAALAFLLGVLTIVVAVLMMFRRDARPYAVFAAVSAFIGTLAAGLVFAVGGAIAVIGAVIAARLDRSLPLV